jgi:macrolide-specific efflux system membrane fusion protein
MDKTLPPAPAGAPRSASHSPHLGPRLALVALAVLLLAGAGYYAWRTWLAAPDARSTYLSAAVTRGNLEDAVTATGTLQPRDYVDVGTQVSGQLKKLRVEIGSEVKKGDLLAEIDQAVYQSRVDSNRAQLRNQHAQLADRQSQRTLAEQQLTRQQNLARENATTTEALQTAEAALRSATAQIEALRAQIQQTESTLRGDEANLGYTRIFAPMSGTVVSQNAKEGQTLNANQQAPIVLRIADLSTMTVQTQVSEADVSKLRVGMEVYFTTLGAQERRWYGRLRQINPTPTAVNNVVLYDALFDVPNANRQLMTQMTAQVFFVVASAKDAVLVPIAALRPVRGGGRRGGEGRSAGAASSPAEGSTVPGKTAGSEAGKSTGAESGKSTGAESGKSTSAESGARKERGERATAAGGDPRALYANGRALVRVVAADGSVAEREIAVGTMNRVSAQVLSGLEPGEQVVVGTRQQNVPQRPAAGAQGAPKMTPRI